MVHLLRNRNASGSLNSHEHSIGIERLLFEDNADHANYPVTPQLRAIDTLTLYSTNIVGPRRLAAVMKGSPSHMLSP